MSDKLRKYVLPNVPYLFVLWLCLKLGTAYRLAPGADVWQKLTRAAGMIPAAFADFSPGLHPSDWLIGIAGAAILRLVIYFKVKNAKKWRKDREYGSARWGAYYQL